MIHPQKLILVAASREETLILFHQVLGRAGYDVVLAATAEEALAQARRHRPDLILVEPDLAGGEARELALRLKADPDTARVPLAAISEGAEPEHALREAGFCGAVAQRDPLRALLEAVRRCLDGAAGAGPWRDLPGAPAAA